MVARKARVEGAAADSGLAAIVEAFKAKFPDDWETLRLCPLQHGLDTMIEKLTK